MPKFDPLLLTIVAFVNLPILFMLKMGWLNLLFYLMPILAVLALSFDSRRTLKIPLHQILAALLLLLSLASLLGLLSGTLGAFLAMLMILLSGLGFVYEDGLAKSLALSSVIGGLVAFATAFLLYLSRWEGLSLLLPLFAMASALLILYRRRGSRQVFTLDSYLLLFFILLLLYLSEFAAVYPNFFKLTSNDLIEHQAEARMLVTSPKYYSMWSYVGFHSFLSATYLLTKANAFSLMLSSILLNLLAAMLIYLAFSELEWRKEALFIWGMFTGFGWLAALVYGFDVSGLNKASINSYRSLIWSQPIYFWGLPLTLGIGLLALLLYLDIHSEGRRKLYYVAMTLTLAFLVHVAEAIVFIAYLMAKSLFLGGDRESSLGSLVAGAVLTGLYLYPAAHSGVGPSASLLLLLGAIASLALGELRDRYLGLRISSLFLNLKRWDKEIVSFLLALYLAGLVIWLLHLGQVDVNAIYDLGQVPWFFYPVLLGVPGLLAILSLEYKFPKEFALLVFVSLLMGRTITYYKLFVGPLSYWEYRFPFYASLGLAVLSSLYLHRLLKGLESRRVYSILLALIIFSGYASTALGAQSWNYINVYRMSVLNDVDFDFASNISYFDEHPRTPALFLTPYTYYLIKVAAPRERMNGLPYWLSSGPEVALYSLGALSSTREVAALTTLNDISYLERLNASLFSYVRRFMGPIWDVPSLTLLNLSSPPTPESKLAVVFPADTYLRRRALVAYELIRQKLPAHTTYLSDDPLAPAGIYVGPASDKVEVKEDLPESPYDLRWLFIWGNFSEGLMVHGGRGIAISIYELDEGTFNLTACNEGASSDNGYVGLIYDFRNFNNYKIAQYYFSGLLTLRTVVNGKVTTGKPIRIPAGEGCLNLSLQLANGTVYGYLNGERVKLGEAEKLGILGFETGNFTGTISGSVRGSHSLIWNPPKGSTLISVLGGNAELDLTGLVNLGMRNLTEARREFKGLHLDINFPNSSPGEGVREASYVARRMEASGEVVIEGRPIWYMDASGEKSYLNASSVRIEANKLSFREGIGFYVDLELSGIRGLDVEDAIVRFRTPIRVQVVGNMTLRDAHPFSGFISDTEDVKTDEANVSIMMADGTIIFYELSYRKAAEGGVSRRYEAFDESKFLPESVVIVAATITALYISQRKLIWKEGGKDRMRRRKRL